MTGYLREGYKTSKRTWRGDGPPGADNFQTEHWDGRLDAEVRPRALSYEAKKKGEGRSGR